MAITASRAFSDPKPKPVAPAYRAPYISIAHSEDVSESSAILRQQDAAAVIMARSRGVEARLVGIAQLEDFQALIIRSGARLRRARDLRDQRIGLPGTGVASGSPRVHALRAAAAVLEAEGLFFRGVEWVDLPPAEAVTRTLPGAYAAEMAALHDGTVDAVYVRGPAGLEAARLAGARVLVDVGAHRDPWLRAHTALLHAVTVNATLLRQHPQVVARELLERWPLLPARLNLDQASLGAFESLKTFMFRWAFIRTDFTMETWTD